MLFADLGKLVRRDADLMKVQYAKAKCITHLTTDYSRSPFLASLGVSVVRQLCLITICHDCLLLIEPVIQASDGLSYDRTECLSRQLWRYPTPQQIKEQCAAIRARKPVSDYAEQWTGEDASGIREIPITEINWC